MAVRLWYVILCVLALIVLWGAVVAAAGVSPKSCGVCHVSDAGALDDTPHAGIRCDVCHAQPGTFGMVESRISMMQMVLDRAVPGGDPEPAYVGNDHCIVCHAPVLVGATVSNGIRMDHRAVVRERWSCTRCHAMTAHGPASLRKTGYNMDMCLQCHSTNPANPATCETCHPDGPPETAGAGATDGQPGGEEGTGGYDYSTPWQATHGENVRKTHGMGNLDTCSACHAEEQCLACHTTEMPHPSNYLAVHGPQVLAAENADCFTCHTRAMCEDCHQIEMPHPADFFEGHSETVNAEGQELCLRCHAEEACTTCHLEHVHPGLPPNVRDSLQGNLVQ